MKERVHKNMMRYACLLHPVMTLLCVLFQPKHDMAHLMEGLQEYKGILSTFPDVLSVYKVCLLHVDSHSGDDCMNKY